MVRLKNLEHSRMTSKAFDYAGQGRAGQGRAGQGTGRKAGHIGSTGGKMFPIVASQLKIPGSCTGRIGRFAFLCEWQSICVFLESAAQGFYH